MKNSEIPQQQPGQIPSAPPSYEEVMNGSSCTFPNNTSQMLYSQNPPHPNVSGTMHQPMTPPIIQPTVVEVQRTVIAALGPSPAHITCPNCHFLIVTVTETEPNCAAHLCCLFLLVIGCCPFSSLPYCMDSLKNVRHYCPNCKVFLGSYQP